MAKGRDLNRDLIAWWYGDLFAAIFAVFKYLILFIYDFFSVETCVKTLFAVWRRDMISYSNMGLAEIFKAWGLNTASRLIGFFIKMMVIFIYLIFMALYFSVFGIVFTIWLFFPLILAGLVFWGFRMIGGY